MPPPRRTRRAAPSLRPPANARELAFAVLEALPGSKAFVNQLFDEQARRAGLAAEERRLAMEIVYGVVRRPSTLDALLRPHVRRPRHAIEDRLWILMQIGAWQIAGMGLPAHAAVHETVEIARRQGNPRWTGFLNGVLRALAQSSTDELVDRPAADAVPVSGGRYRRLHVAAFPDPATDEEGYLAEAFGFPRWMVRRWRARFGFDETARCGFWFNAPAPLWLRANLLKTSREGLRAALAAAGIEALPGSLPESLLVTATARQRSDAGIEHFPGFRDGSFTVQDESAMRAARLLAPEAGETVLDLCAAPGTKTTHLAELMQDQGRLIATDIHTDRLARVEENCRRLGITIVGTQPIGAGGAGVPRGPYDAALVDVPCSNTGVLGKRPEARWRVRPEDLAELSALQRRLLGTACDLLRPGGRVVYSTCSIEPEENRDVVRAVLDDRTDVTLVEDHEHLPGRPADGAYQALIRRTGGPA